jgi:hypothetical protein
MSSWAKTRQSINGTTTKAFIDIDMKNNIIAFNFEKALEGEPIFTRDGRAVTEWVYFKGVTTEWSIVAVVGGQVTSYTKNGRFSTTHKNPLDLVMKGPIIIEKWVNVYHFGDRLFLGVQFNSEEEAKWAYTTDNDCYTKEYLYIKTIKIDNQP